ncbi:hypothetical protein COLO4_37485 [Corchorus olitorius]|uniref:Uncharacterized protein n=1 Tax=Corchorus olitorius TaxID=93759 RepID=A0A1R3G1E7_9ROSI|nr:hypothetical protein COLO4_37485 [Corchorus olitorius]
MATTTNGVGAAMAAAARLNQTTLQHENCKEHMQRARKCSNLQR